jgi:FkbM family methyltransferase
VDEELRKIESLKLSKPKRILKQTLEKLDIAVMRFRTFHLLIENSKNFRKLQELDTSEISKSLIEYLVKNCNESQSQLFQDLIVMYISDNFMIEPSVIAPKVFVEFGACDGIKFSNTFLLEKNGWKGIVAEPARKWHKKLKANRNCKISLKAVTSVSGNKLYFVETVEGEFSSLRSFAESDMFGQYRMDNTSSEYLVDTISLNDLIKENGFYQEITYLSIDTEGGERSILESFDFKQFNPAIISVEHNYSVEQENLDHLLLDLGFIKVLTTLSRFESWYVNADRIRLPSDGLL